jgi:type II secretory pathway pseudopilin PulG
MKCGAQVAGAVGQAGAKKDHTARNVLIIIMIAVFSLFFIIMLGIVAAILIPNILRAREIAEFQNCRQALTGLRDAEEMYMSSNGKYADFASLEKLGMYLIPDCKNKEGCEKAVKEKIKGKNGESGSCTDFAIETPDNGLDYRITGTAKTRTGCKICITPRGAMPETYGGCSENAVCP